MEGESTKQWRHGVFGETMKSDDHLASSHSKGKNDTTQNLIALLSNQFNLQNLQILNLNNDLNQTLTSSDFVGSHDK